MTNSAEILDIQPNIIGGASFRDFVSGHLGRLGVRLFKNQQTEINNETFDASPKINEFLDKYETQLENGLPSADLQYDNNNDEVAKLVDTLEHAPQLDRPVFLPEINTLESKKILTINPTTEEPIFYLPTNNFVYAIDMENWDIGRKGPKSGESSRKIIIDYARQRTPPPPIGYVCGYVQPNGLVLYSVIQDGAHRVAAAIRRGDKSIAVGRPISIRRLSKNIIES
jgi:hypothetical protein